MIPQRGLIRVDDEIRTRDPNLGKVMRYRCATSTLCSTHRPEDSLLFARQVAAVIASARPVERRGREERTTLSPKPFLGQQPATTDYACCVRTSRATPHCNGSGWSLLVLFDQTNPIRSLCNLQSQRLEVETISIARGMRESNSRNRLGRRVLYH
jgi:hypothetical protein